MTLVLLIAQLGMVLIVAMLLGRLAERFRLPAIAGQLLAGVVLGRAFVRDANAAPRRPAGW